MNQQLEETINSFMNAIQIKPSGIMIWISLAGFTVCGNFVGNLSFIQYETILSAEICSNFSGISNYIYHPDGSDTNEYCTFPWNDRFVINCKISYEYS